VALAALVALLACGTPAAAFVVEVTTSVGMTGVTDRPGFERAMQSALDGVLRDAIAFTPTLVVITGVVIVDGRVHLHLLIADRDGEEELAELLRNTPDARASSPELSL
jgi:hypothetical protein